MRFEGEKGPCVAMGSFGNRGALVRASRVILRSVTELNRDRTLVATVRVEHLNRCLWVVRGR